jgi:hypothetical protein
MGNPARLSAATRFYRHASFGQPDVDGLRQSPDFRDEQGIARQIIRLWKAPYSAWERFFMNPVFYKYYDVSPPAHRLSFVLSR